MRSCVTRLCCWPARSWASRFVYARAASARSVRAAAGALARVGRLGADGDLLPADAAFLSPLALVGHRLARHRCLSMRLHLAIGLATCARTGGMWKGRAQAADNGKCSTLLGQGPSGREFPGRLVILKRAHRAPIMAFYRFARSADDIADHPLPRRPRSCAGWPRCAPAVGRRAAIRTGAGRCIPDDASSIPVHARDLLGAFEQDVTVTRYADWDALIDYCRMSAMPVGRFVLDVHGEDRALLAGLRCTVRGAAGHQSSAGLRRRIIARSAASISRSTCSPRMAPPPRISQHPPHRLPCVPRSSPPWPSHAGTARPERALRRDDRDRRLATEVAIIQKLAVEPRSAAADARSAVRARSS
jgi:hypothetical protein